MAKPSPEEVRLRAHLTAIRWLVVLLLADKFRTAPSPGALATKITKEAKKTSATMVIARLKDAALSDLHSQEFYEYVRRLVTVALTEASSGPTRRRRPRQGRPSRGKNSSL
jgi:hypothetical protein